ncbi:hypothetical protein HK100_004771 [Physocladia obscura]|uniref:Methyltransferase domain-containing protein n=1 Tax=Physocladia obscura TaxID=109957 RepID=A0AAD5STH7_9FUNG|nr:hypothetical protein HK100_004771 [Physocladia obscura]
MKTPGVKTLDVGCANGWWLDSINKTYPSAELYGVDIATDVITAALKRLPAAKFSFANVAVGLPFDNDTFDYTHQRQLCLGLQKEEFPLAIQELIRVTKNGGWIELVEV